VDSRRGTPNGAFDLWPQASGNKLGGAMKAFGASRHQRSRQVTDDMLRTPGPSLSQESAEIFSAPLNEAWSCAQCSFRHDDVCSQLTECTICGTRRGSAVEAPAFRPTNRSQELVQELRPSAGWGRLLADSSKQNVAPIQVDLSPERLTVDAEDIALMAFGGGGSMSALPKRPRAPCLVSPPSSYGPPVKRERRSRLPVPPQPGFSSQWESPCQQLGARSSMLAPSWQEERLNQFTSGEQHRQALERADSLAQSLIAEEESRLRLEMQANAFPCLIPSPSSYGSPVKRERRSRLPVPPQMAETVAVTSAALRKEAGLVQQEAKLRISKLWIHETCMSASTKASSSHCPEDTLLSSLVMAPANQTLGSASPLPVLACASGDMATPAVTVGEEARAPPRQTLTELLVLLPTTLPAPVDSSSHLYRFWRFMAQALLGASADDQVCRTFKLGGTIDKLSDVVFARDHITKPYLEKNDLKSVIWHHMLICWLGAGGPRQESYQWLCTDGLAKAYRDTDSAVVTEIYKRVESRVSEHGFSSIFDGDSRAVKFRLDPKQQGEPVLQKWFNAVPLVEEALEAGISPDKFEQKLRSIYFVGELTAKELFVLLSYARPRVADTTRHIAVGPGARDGAFIVLGGDDAPAVQGRGNAPQAEGPEAAPAHGRGRGRNQAPKPFGGAGGEGLEAMRRILSLQPWALENIPHLAEACRDYRASAPHRLDPLRNCRITRDHLFDFADVEVMLCYYKNYNKLCQRFGSAAIPTSVCPRGWERRA